MVDICYHIMSFLCAMGDICHQTKLFSATYIAQKLSFLNCQVHLIYNIPMTSPEIKLELRLIYKRFDQD